MKASLLSVVLCLVLATPAWGASELQAVRARAEATRTQLRGLRGQQQALREELHTLAARIEALKAERQGRLTAGAQLEAALRRSQELSGELTGLAQAVAGAEGEVERAALVLHAALSEELSRVRAAWDSTSGRQQRAALLERMRTLRAERDAVRAALPPSAVPAPRPSEASDDPEDLLEQADALRDAEDKVRQRLGALQARITEVREERELERRMSDFLGEESMFDEPAPHLRLRLDESRRLAVEDAPRAPSPSLAGGDSPEAAPNDTAPSPPLLGGEPAPGAPSPSPAPSQGAILTTPTARASDVLLPTGRVRAQPLATGDMDDLESLRAEAARLEALAGELDSRADALEGRVRQLE